MTRYARQNRSSLTLAAMRKIIILLLMLVSLSDVYSETRPLAIRYKTIEASDPIRPILEGLSGEIRQSYYNSPLNVNIGDWFEIPSNVLSKLFPDTRFARVTWHESQKPGAQKVLGIAAGLNLIVAIKSHKEIVGRFHESGEYESFGEFLAKYNVMITTDKDAKTIWDAFCDLHHKGYGKDRPFEKKTAYIWHLGLSTSPGINRYYRYYYEVVTDKNGKVEKAKLMSRPL